MSTTDARIVRGTETRNRILVATRVELRKHGQDLTLDHIAARLALTKQAVLYHFPSKDRLLIELALLGLAEEADAMVAAMEHARSAVDAVHRFLRANLAFHPRRSQRSPDLRARPGGGGQGDATPPSERKARLYPVTARMYPL